MINVVSLSRKFLSRRLSLNPTCVIQRSAAAPSLACLMPTETKEFLHDKIAELGETMPKSSSTLQLKARLAELRDQFKNQMGPSLKDRMTELNKASRKKATLIEFAEKQEVPILQSDTIARIYAKVEAKFNQEVPGTSLDKVGFGKFADKTYGQILVENPSYIKWVIQTAEENQEDAHWRLRRLATWSVIQQTPPNLCSKPMPPSPPIGGYHIQGPGKLSHHLPEDSSDGSFQAVTSSDQEQIQRLAQELEQIKSEKAELELRLGSSKMRKEM